MTVDLTALEAIKLAFNKATFAFNLSLMPGTETIGKVGLVAGTAEIGKLFGGIFQRLASRPSKYQRVCRRDGFVSRTLSFGCVSYTIKNTGANSIKWTVFGANQANFADAVEAQAEAVVTAGSIGSYSAEVAVWRYYKVQVKSSAADTPGAAQVRGLAKA